MIQFDVIKKQLLDIEKKDDVNLVKDCRNLLENIIKDLYEIEKEDFSKSATLLELIDNSFIVKYIDEKRIIDDLHFIRILGNNAKNGKYIKRTEAKKCFYNICSFVEFLNEKQNHASINIDFTNISEAETRKLYIDLYLKEAGWEILEKQNVIVPSKAGIEIEVAGMPNSQEVGYCDYVLYGKDGKPLAIVEAKKTSSSPEKGRKQVILYGDCMKAKYGYVPILYYTNGYEIWCIDGFYPDRKLIAFHTQNELELLLHQQDHKDLLNAKLNENIAGRPYQKIAISKVCERLNSRQRRCLLVMATGTGKTRTAISIVDVLTRYNWVKNVLFLADRTSLVDQAFRNFKKMLPEQSFCVLSDQKFNDDKNARIMFSTYQTMINYIDVEDKKFTAGRFDLIIIDEAHRSIFNKYSSIFSYFDSLLIGLTATPREEVDANTYRIFNCESGEPNFAYSLEEAVADHYLVPYEVLNYTTNVLKNGISYNQLTLEEKEKLELAYEVPELYLDANIEKNKIFKEIYNEPTCDKVLQKIMDEGLKVENNEKLGKTIIFAFNHKHAEMIVERFRALYPEFGKNYCQLVDNYVNYSKELILDFENKDEFRIAVSVDMMDTGVDVPSVLNLVFFKQIHSKIKFVQMIGRGTRLCENIFGPNQNKKCFLIFDFCGNFEFFNCNFNPPVPKKTLSLSQRLFNTKLDIACELQKIEHQEVEFDREYHLKLVSQLFQEMILIKKHSELIRVRENMAVVDKYYSNQNRWKCLSLVEQKEIQLYITPLIITYNGNEECEAVKLFDARMLNIEIGMIACENKRKTTNDVAVVEKVAQYLLNRKASVPQVMQKSESLKLLCSEQYWKGNPNIETIEKLREDVRDLMQFLDKQDPIYVVLNVFDNVMDGDKLEDNIIDIRTYKQKVIDYLFEHSDLQVIHKIKNLDKINQNDLAELENILWNELGTKDDFNSISNTDNLAVFVRSIIGLDQEAINSKFGQFLNENVLNSNQQEFIKSIIDYVRVNGNIEKDDLLDKSPFNNYDLIELFSDKIYIVTKVIDVMQNSVMLAA